ncbi:hypothetical protein F5I97DRAFT_1827813 [Phlebopus sp. FC_14]|nr:hypothetical protein F5I97DRAFT_1827813 [Phlebopus sp. FC_14]
MSSSSHLRYSRTYGAGHQVSTDHLNGTSRFADFPSQILNDQAATTGPSQTVDHDRFLRLVRPGVVLDNPMVRGSNIYGTYANSFASTSIRQAPHLPTIHGYGNPSSHVMIQHLWQGPSSIPAASFDDGMGSVDPISYVCKWNEGGFICGRHVLGTRTQMNHHLHAFHGFGGGERRYMRCHWDGCTARMQRGSIARHIVVTCPLCSKELLRRDVLTKHLRALLLFNDAAQLMSMPANDEDGY